MANERMKTATLLYFLTCGAEAPAYALNEQGRLTTKEPVTGPDGLIGQLATPCAGIQSLEYMPTYQRWVNLKCETGNVKSEQQEAQVSSLKSQVWLGVALNEKPSPGDLLRAEIRTGHQVKLGDGQFWEIPVARLALGGSGLPRRRVLREDGTAAWEVESAYTDLSAAAERVWQHMQGQSVNLKDVDVDDLCGAALAVNYRLGRPEALALGLLTDSAITALLEALVDMPTVRAILEAQKKSSATPVN